jgi:hypothetical protein
VTELWKVVHPDDDCPCPSTSCAPLQQTSPSQIRRAAVLAGETTDETCSRLIDKVCLIISIVLLSLFCRATRTQRSFHDFHPPVKLGKAMFSLCPVHHHDARVPDKNGREKSE